MYTNGAKGNADGKGLGKPGGKGTGKGAGKGKAQGAGKGKGQGAGVGAGKGIGKANPGASGMRHQVVYAYASVPGDVTQGAHIHIEPSP